MTKHRTRNVVYTVQGVATTPEAAAAIDRKIDAVLHNGTLTVTGYTNFWMAREEDINFSELDLAGVTYYHAGGQYRIRIDDT